MTSASILDFHQSLSTREEAKSRRLPEDKRENMEEFLQLLH